MNKQNRKLPRRDKKRYYKGIYPKIPVNFKGVDPEVYKIAMDIAENLKLHPSPEAIAYVANEIHEAQKEGTIVSGQIKKASAALFLAGAKNAVDNKKIRIQPSNIKKQWKVVGIGNCPPHRCLRRTVFDDTEKFKNNIGPLKDYLL